MVALVEITFCRAAFACADTATVIPTRAQAAETAHRRSPTCANARRDVALRRETLDRTAGDGSPAVGRRGEPSCAYRTRRRPPTSRRNSVPTIETTNFRAIPVYTLRLTSGFASAA